MKTRGIALILCLTMALTLLAGCGGDSSSDSNNTSPAPDAATDEPIVIEMGHIITEDNPTHLALVRFAELVSERSEGRIEIKIYPNGTLGYDRDMLEGMQAGTVDGGAITTAPFSNFTDELELFDMPFLFESKEHAHAVVDSYIGEDILASLEQYGLIGLAFYENGFRDVSCSKPIQTPEDMKGVKIRTMESAIYLDTFNALGASPIAMAWGEVYTALQQKTIDAQENGVVNTYLAKIHEVTPYYSVINQIYSCMCVTLSKVVWDELSTEDQELLRQCAKDSVEYNREVAAQLEEDYLTKMEEEGATIIRDIDKSVWREAVQSVYDKHTERFGADRLAAIAEMAE